MRVYGRTNFKNLFTLKGKYFTVRNAYVDTSNTSNQFYKPKNEMNYEVYETSFKEYFVPSQALANINDNGLSIFKFEPAVADETGFVKLPQVPYEIKEHALKGFLYTFFLTIIGRMIAAFGTVSSYSVFPFIPAGVFFFQYSKSLLYLFNSVTEISLLKDGQNVRLSFKFRPDMTISISQIIKKQEENFLNECFTEPTLYPIQINRVNEYGKYSLRSHLTVYLYSDSHKCIKNGEILRAILNNQPIKLS